jgi:RNA polymerase sigma-70 factor (ECF subfamily)
MSGAARDSWLAFCRAAELDSSSDRRAAFESVVARAAFVGPGVDPSAFAAHLGRKVAGEDEPVAALAGLRIEELSLAFACAHAAPRALAHFEREFGGDIARGLAQAGTPGDAGQDAGQLIRQKLFVGEPGRSPKILDYAGRGPLRAWLRITAVRTSLNLERARQRRPDQCSPEGDDDLVHAAAEAYDPELAYLKNHYRDQFKQAFEHAVAELPDRDRNVLRHHLVERLSIDEIGTAYGVHRATAARWIAAAREAIRGRVRAVMTERFGVPPEQLDSVMRLVQSELDLSVHRVLGER